MKTKPKRKQVRSEKSQEETALEEVGTTKKSTPVRGGKEANEVLVVVADRKTQGKNVNNKNVVSGSNNYKTRGKKGPKKNDNINQKKVNEDVDNDDEAEMPDDDEGDEEELGENDDEYLLEEEREDDYEISDSDSSIGYEKPYYGGRKKLPSRAAATQKIDYSDNHYYHEFQEYFHARVDDDDEPRRKKSSSTSTKKRSSKKLYSDDDNYSDMSSSSLDLRPSKKPRKKKLPHRESKEKKVDYSDNKYFRQFDSALNAKIWSDKLLDDDDDDEDGENTNNNNNNNDNEQGTNKKHGGNEKNKKSATSTPRKTPVSTPQKTPKNRSN